MKVIFALLSLVLLPLSIQLHAQITDPAKIQQKDKTLVSVPVTVSDREGHYISGLKKQDFTVYEDDVKTEHRLFCDLRRTAEYCSVA